MGDRILYVTFGTIIGSVVTYILMKKHCEEYIHEELRLAKEHEAEARQKVVVKKPAGEKSENKNDDVVVGGVDLARKVAKEEPPTDYTAYSNGKEERMTSLITSERFANEEPEFEKITLNFYEKDGVLADNYGDIVDIEKSIGLKAVSYFELLHTDVVYIRNEKLKIDYEIVLEHEAYSEQYNEGFRDDID